MALAPPAVTALAAFLAASLVVLAAPGAAWAQAVAVSPRAERTSVVIYRDAPVDTAKLMERAADPYDAQELRAEGLALIVETRTLDLPAGETVIRFQGVASGIAPQTALVEGLPGGTIERNADFDLLTPGSLLTRSAGERVRVARINRQTGEETLVPALLRASAEGPVLEIDGRFEALDCQGLTQRILFDRVPEGLSDQPILSVRTRTPEAGRYTVTLAYLATGLQWSADYVARLNPDGRTLNLTGWITLANFSGSGFTDAPVQVVAGNLNRDDDTRPVEPVLDPGRRSCWPTDTTTRGVSRRPQVQYSPPPAPMAMRAAVGGLGDASDISEIVVTGSRIVARLSNLGDYKVYTLPEPTDVNARQTKQVRFLEQDGVRFTRIYRQVIRADDEGEPLTPMLLLRLRNETRDGLGVPMPGGGVSLFETQGAFDLLTGQTSFRDKGVGLPVELEFGGAMDLTVEHEIVEEDTVGEGEAQRERREIEVVVSNDKPFPIEIELSPEEYSWRGFRIVQANARSVIADGGYPAWRLRLPARSSRTLRYTIEFDESW
jgi:hypothetical protein